MREVKFKEEWKMKERKFKAWQQYHKVMLEVKEIEFDNKGIKSILVEYPNGYAPKLIKYERENKEFSLDAIILLDYVGSKDKTGKEIYEGDIVDVLIAGDWIRGIIFWDKNRGCWNIKDKDDMTYYDFYQGQTFFEAIEEIKVIGNIFENLKLLKGNENE